MANYFIELDVENAKAIEQALYALGTDRRWKAAMRRALVKSGRPVAEQAERLAPKETGRMADKIQVNTQLSKRQRSQARRLGKRNDPNVANAFIGAGSRGPAVLMEFGTGPRRTKTGKYTGAVAARPFMRPAWEAGKDGVLSSFQRDLWREIEASAKRIEKQAMRSAKKGKR